MRRSLLLLMAISLVTMLAGCLSVESKEYRFKLNPDGSGSGTITFVNIVSQDDDGRDVSFKDFGELVTDYLEGSSFEEQSPLYQVTNKRLFEQDGKLHGEVAFTFTSFDSVGFFRQPGCDCCPILLYKEAFQETFAESNGQFQGDNAALPFVRWAADSKEFYLKTTVMDDLSGTRSLLSHWKDWKK